MSNSEPLTKLCKKCGQEKPLTAEFWQPQNDPRYKQEFIRHACRLCRSAERRAWYRERRRTNPEFRQSGVQRNRDWVWNYLKQHPCLDCGEDDPVVLEFDHLRDKEYNVAHLVNGRSLATLVAEVEKCEVVCANCHRRRTARRGGFWRHVLAG